MLNKIFGHFSWNSPQWIKQLQHKAKENPKQFISRAFFSLVFLIAAIGIYQWYQSLPKPERIIAKITLPKLTPPEATLIPDVLTIDFGISYNGAFNSRSVAPLNLVGKEISKDIAINPPIPGQWRWDSDSRLVFTPESDWPAEQSYQI